MDYTPMVLMQVVGPTLVAAVGVWAHKRRTQVDVGAEAERKAIHRDNAPIDFLIKENEAAREHLKVLMENHFTHDRDDRAQDRDGRDRLVKVLAETQETMRSIKDEIIAHRQEERERSASFHERFNGLDKSVEFLKAKP